MIRIISFGQRRSISLVTGSTNEQSISSSSVPLTYQLQDLRGTLAITTEEVERGFSSSYVQPKWLTEPNIM